MAKKKKKVPLFNYRLLFVFFIVITAIVFGLFRYDQNKKERLIKEDRVALDTLSGMYSDLKTKITKTQSNPPGIIDKKFCKLEKPSVFAKKIPYCGEDLAIYISSTQPQEALNSLSAIISIESPFITTTKNLNENTIKDVYLNKDDSNIPNGFVCTSKANYPFSSSNKFSSETSSSMYDGSLAVIISCRMPSSSAIYELLP